jgi:hypothetical protein
MNEDKLLDISDDFDSYAQVLCKAILLDKVKIIDGKIKVESWE